jgi:homopolymeric O-antigen transport system permease protein
MSAFTEAPSAYRHSSVRPGSIGLIQEAIREVSSRRRLIQYLVQADLKKKGSDTLLGNLWWVIDPLLQMLVYVVLVSVIFVRSTPDYPLFVFAAILPWKWFTSSIADAITSVVSQDKLIKQIQFPKIVLPFAAVYSGIANFAFGMIPLGILLILFYRDRLTPNLVFIAPIAGVQFVFTLALGFLVSAINVFFRDLGNVARHVLRLWFYLSPGLYSMALLEHSALFEKSPMLTTLVSLNPFAILFTAYRTVIYGTDVPQTPPAPPDWAALGGLLLASCILLALTTIVFKRLEPSFAKVL